MYEIIQALCKSNGTTITVLCEKITGSRGNLATWKKGNIRNDYLLKIAEYFNVSTDYLLGNEQKEKTSPQLSDEAIRLGLKLDKLSRENKELVLKLIDSMIVK